MIAGIREGKTCDTGYTNRKDSLLIKEKITRDGIRTMFLASNIQRRQKRGIYIPLHFKKVKKENDEIKDSELKIHEWQAVKRGKRWPSGASRRDRARVLSWHMTIFCVFLWAEYRKQGG